jgi:hypothetical protein
MQKDLQMGTFKVNKIFSFYVAYTDITLNSNFQRGSTGDDRGRWKQSEPFSQQEIMDRKIHYAWTQNTRKHM